MKAVHLAAVLLLATAAAAQSHASSSDAQVRINQIQIIGSHNSYHAGLLLGVRAFLAKEKPESLRGLDYAHQPLDKQFDGGVRQIELDIFADSKGGRYTHPAGPAAEAAAGVTVDPVDNRFSGASLDVMMKPGFKVMHVQDLDQHSNCQPFTACLTIVRNWSRAHPRHLPIFVLVETKQGRPLNIPNATTPEPFTAATFDALDREIRSVFSADEMITPDDMRGSHATPNEAARANAWPTLEKARGNVIFLMDQRSAGPLYLEGHANLRGRVLFTNAAPGQPDAAFTEENDGTEQEIAALVREGYLVRTRTDADTKEGRSGSTERRDHAMASGAQILSTDYPKAEPAQWTGYFVSFAGDMMARCNPVAGNAACRNSDLRDSDFIDGR
ncbi:MAG TPA: phosphatidylinositol-specific phospholipase C1-like protein [Acidobacteriaceae bacterium]